MHVDNEPNPEDEKLNEAKPTVTTKNHAKFKTFVGDIDAYSSQTVEGSPNVETIQDAQTGEIEGEATINYKTFKHTKGSNGSNSYGIDGFSVGIDGNSVTFDASVRNSTGTGGGITVKMSPAQLILNAVLLVAPEIRAIQYLRTVISF